MMDIRDAFGELRPRSFGMSKPFKFVGGLEIRHVLTNIGEKFTHADDMIRMADTDGDGKVSFEDFGELVTSTFIGEGEMRACALDIFANEHSIKRGALEEAFKRVLATDTPWEWSDEKGQAYNGTTGESTNDKPDVYNYNGTTGESTYVNYTNFCNILQLNPAPEVQHLFQVFDNNCSGHIDIREFLISLSNFVGASKNDRLKFAFMLFDQNGNAAISKQELVKILKANYMTSNDREAARQAEKVFYYADKDGHGVVYLATVAATSANLSRCGPPLVPVCALSSRENLIYSASWYSHSRAFSF